MGRDHFCQARGIKDSKFSSTFTQFPHLISQVPTIRALTLTYKTCQGFSPHPPPWYVDHSIPVPVWSPAARNKSHFKYCCEAFWLSVFWVDNWLISACGSPTSRLPKQFESPYSPSTSFNYWTTQYYLLHIQSTTGKDLSHITPGVIIIPLNTITFLLKKKKKNLWDTWNTDLEMTFT